MDLESLPMVRNRHIRLSLKGALLVSLGLHLLLLLVFSTAVPEDFLLIQRGEARAAPEAVLASGSQPVRFTFVNVPDDEGVEKNPNANLFSDKNRRARQPEPTPPDATELGDDPHSEGNTRLRQLASAGAPPPPVPPQPPRSPAGEDDNGNPEDLPGNPDAQGEEGEGEDLASAREEGRGPALEGGRKGSQGSTRPDQKTAFREALEKLRSGSYDLSTFQNPSYLESGNYGTLSFDTQDFDWGDYSRQIYEIIKKNWYDRIPIAAWYGQKGRVFLRFVIERDGSISGIEMTRSSGVSPLDLAAENAIRASHPLPPLPADFPGQTEGVRFGFYYNLPVDQP